MYQILIYLYFYFIIIIAFMFLHLNIIRKDDLNLLLPENFTFVTLHCLWNNDNCWILRQFFSDSKISMFGFVFRSVAWCQFIRRGFDAKFFLPTFSKVSTSIIFICTMKKKHHPWHCLNIFMVNVISLTNLQRDSEAQIYVWSWYLKWFTSASSQIKARLFLTKV